MRKRNRRYDEPGSAPELLQTPADKFRAGTFLVIIDNLDAELRKRLSAYTYIAGRFGFLQKLADLPAEEESFPTDLEDSLCDELLQFSGFLNTEFAKKGLDATTPSASDSSTPGISSDEFIEDDDIDVTEDDNLIRLNVESLELRMYKLLVTNNLETVFPNTVIALCI